LTGHAQAVAEVLPAGAVRPWVQAMQAPAAVFAPTEKVLTGHMQDVSAVFVAPPLPAVPTNVPPTTEVRAGVPAQAVHPAFKLAPYLPAGHVQEVLSWDPAAAKEPRPQGVHVRMIFVEALAPYVFSGHKQLSTVVPAHV